MSGSIGAQGRVPGSSMEAAGSPGDRQSEGAAGCLHDPVHRPPTPERVRPHQRASRRTPGQRAVHPGRAFDSLPYDSNTRFGTRTTKPESLADALQHEPTSELARQQKDEAENIYHSSKAMPLGKPMRRGYNVPDQRLGIRTENADKPSYESPAKEAIYGAHPSSQQPDDRVPPGAQRTRNYDWNSSRIDPSQFRFGKLQSTKAESAAEVLHPPEQSAEQGASARVVNKQLHDFQLATKDRLGRSQRQPAYESSSTEPPAGVSSLREHEAGVGELLKHSELDESAAQPDQTLACQVPTTAALPESKRNQVFGIPTVRTDVPEPARRSVANWNNYGKDPRADAVVFPAEGVDRGVQEEEYMKPLSLEEIKQVYNSAGIQLDDEEAEVVVKKASDFDGREDGKCTLATFQTLKAQLEKQLKMQQKLSE